MTRVLGLLTAIVALTFAMALPIIFWLGGELRQASPPPAAAPSPTV